MEDLHRFLKSHPEEPHGYISLPTGVGKTVLFTELTKATDLKTLILMPTKGLISQTEEAFQRFGDVVQIGKVFSDHKNSSERITLSTYASFVRHTKRGSHHIAPGQFDLIILDEAHRALGDETKHIIEQYKDAIQIGFTATEEYTEQRRLQSVLPTEIHKMTINEAVTHGLITPFINTVVKTGVDVSSVRVTQTNEYDASDMERVLNTGNRNGIALKLYERHFAGQKAVIFCNGVEHAKAVAERFQEAGIHAKAMHGKLSLDEQNATKELFASTEPGSIDVLTNDKLLTEGFDVPGVVVCLNLAPTLSRVRAQQRGGRALRLDPANPNKVAHIVDFIDEEYQKPPVLFSDPRIGEGAQVGVDTVTAISLDLDDEDLSIITDPEAVTAMAQEFFEKHALVREYAPEGWLSLGQLNAIYDLSPALIHGSLDVSTRNNPDRARKFHSPYVKGKMQRTYFSPEVVKELVDFHSLTYFDFKETVPVGWIVREEFEIGYSTRLLNSMRERVMHINPGIWVDESITVGDCEYYGPHLRKWLRQSVVPDSHWQPVQPLIEKYDIDETGIEEIMRTVAKKERKLCGLNALWCCVDGEEVLYTFPATYEYIERELLAIRDRVSKPRLLQENKVVAIRSRKSNVADLAQLFNDDIEKQKKEAQRKKQLDALYAEFM